MKSSRTAVPGRGLPVLVISVMLSIIVFIGGLYLAPESHGAARRPHPRRTPGPVSLPAALKIPKYSQGKAPFDDGETLVYEASWEGIPAAEARIALAKNRAHPEWWTGQMWINTSKVVDPLYRMRDYFREDFRLDSWQPDKIYILQHEKTRQDTWRASFDRPRKLVTATKINKEGRTWVRKFSGGDPWGPFSGGMMALSQPLKPGENYVFDVFSGGNRYVFGFKVLARETVMTGLGSFDTLKIEPSVIWLSQGDFRQDATETLIWVTNDAKHLPIRIESAVYIGSVRADLTQVIKGKAAKPVENDDVE